MLFGDALADIDEATGFRGPVACRAAGITYRQLDYWARTGLVEPAIRPATGSGTQRLYSFRDILVLKVVKRSEEHTSELQSRGQLVCRLLLEKKRTTMEEYCRV